MPETKDRYLRNTIKQSPRLTLLMLSIIFILIGGIPTAIAVLLYQIQTYESIENTENDARRLAALLVKSFEQTVTPIDSLLQNFANSFDPDQTPEKIYDSLRSFSMPSSVIQLSVIDRDGILIVSTLSPPDSKRIDLSDREHIRAQLGVDPSSASLFISKPVLGRVSNKWSIQLTRPLGDSRGQFAGVVVASYSIEDFVALYKQLQPDPDVLIALVGLDGIARARSVRTATFGDDVSESKSFKKLSGTDKAPYKESSVIDGVERVGYIVKSSYYPVMIEVAYPMDYVTRQSSGFRRAIQSSFIGLAGTLLLAMLLGWHYLNLQKRFHVQDLEASARRREAEVFLAISRIPGVAVMQLTGEGPSEIGDQTAKPLVMLLRRYLDSSRFRSFASQLSAPAHKSEYLAGEAESVEVDLVIAPIATINGQRNPSKKSDIVVFAVAQTERRMEEAKLYQLSKLASLGELATGLAHEINQPLAVIRLAAANALAGIQRGASIEHVCQKLERISQQTIRMSRIIDHMRIFGRKSDDIIRPSAPLDAVEGAIQIVGAHIRQSQIEIIVKSDSDLNNVLFKQEQLEQVLINLIQNARDAIFDKRISCGENFGGIIRISLSNVELNSISMVKIDVEDNGGGIPEGIIKLIFQPFFTTKPPGKGTGFGLSVSFGIVRDNGAEIEVKNGSEGAVFSVIIPVFKDN